MADGVVMADERAFATEWIDADIRVIRRGEEYKLELRIRNDVGSLCQYTVPIEKRDAGDLREIWVEV